MNNKRIKWIFILIFFIEVLVTYLGNITESSFHFFLKPFIYVALTIVIYLVIDNKYQIKRNKQLTNQVTIYSIILYMLLYFLSGILFGFANNPLKRSGITLVYNCIYFILPVLCIELIRFRIVNNLPKDKFWKYNTILALILMIGLSDISSSMFVSGKEILENFYTVFFPNYVMGLFIGYAGIKGDLYTCLIYMLLPVIFTVLSPLLPSAQWIIPVVLKVLVPILTYIIIDKMEKKSEKNKKTVKKENIWVTLLILILFMVIVMFACGIFRIYPVAIASNSMHPTFSRGDIEIIDKKKQAYEVGDVIQFVGLNDTSFCHRVYSVRKEAGKYYYITKGDNNDDVDILEISEDAVVGKVLFTIKYLGFPTLWISEAFK